MRKRVMLVFVFLCIAAFVFSGVPGRADAAVSPLGRPGTTFAYVKAYGAVEEPYTVDVTLLNRPQGLFLDSDGMLFVSEERGSRVVRKDPSYAPIGQTGNMFTADYTLVNPRDIAKDGSGNLWVADYSRVVQYDVSGLEPAFLQTFPPSDSWVTGSDNDHFSDVQGVAIDHGTGINQHLFVSDAGNNRVQVFRFDSEGKPFYFNTIGALNWPTRMAVDASNRLLIADSNNNRVQRCSSADNWSHWTCEEFTVGAGKTLGYVAGVSVDAGGKVLIADSGNNRVLRCVSSGSCTVQAQGFQFWATDVAGLPNGDILVSDWSNNVVRRYNAQGAEQPVYMGKLNVPYQTTPGHFYTPRGVTVAPDGSIYLVEEYGYRLIKLSASGKEIWTVGTPGIFDASDKTFGNYWAGLEGNPAVDSAGRVYVADTSNDRVQIFNADGSFYKRIGQTRMGGQDNTQFACPTTVAINPVNGDVVVADKCNQRIQVFAAGSLAYKATLGETNVPGSDNTHFRDPWGVTVDAQGALYVADTENFRVQKCTYTTGNSFSCATFAGVTGEGGAELTRLHPRSIAVDKVGRVYAADDWNNRIQVLDPAGDYLTTLSGSWGPGLGEVRSVGGVAVDQANRVYITDVTNSRLLVYALGGGGRWLQINLNNFGRIDNVSNTSLGWFNNMLYAGTRNINGAEIWRKPASGDWQMVASGGLSDASNLAVDHLLAFDGKLYASTWNDRGDGSSKGGEIWRSATGNPGTWTRVVTGGSGTSTADTVNSEFYRLFTFNNQICATSWTNGTHGAEIWCSTTGDTGAWSRTAENGLDGNANNVGILDVLAYDNGKLYAATYNSVEGANVFASDDGAAWQAVFPEGGLGDARNYAATALAKYDGKLYVLITHSSGYGLTLARCLYCDGTDWQELSQPANGFGDPDNRIMPALEVHDGSLYLAAGNNVTGLHMWRTSDGETWEQAAPNGFGMHSTAYTYWGNAFLSAGGNLYLGTYNKYSMTQVWQLGKPLFLPAVGK